MDLAPPARRDPQKVVFWLGALLWVLANVWTWPAALSFGDEVGYVGQARLFLEGRVRPSAEIPGVWHTAPSGALIAKYPLFYPALLVPFVAAYPRSAFAVGIASAVALAWLVSRLLARWGQSPLWGLLVLAHPAVVVISRTLMADVPISALVVGAYFALRTDRLRLAAVLVAATTAIKPTGWLIAGLLLGGEALSCWRDLLARRPAVVRRMAAAAAGFAAGIAVVVALNYAANGSPRFGYYQRFGPPDFRLQFLGTTGWAHAKSLLLNPPLLIVGLWPYWRRRDYGPIAVVAGLVALMSVYFFVDWGRNWADSLVLSQRLILPAVAFLMIGYLDCLAQIAARLPAGVRDLVAARVLPVALAAVPVAVAYQIGTQHRRWQQSMSEALAMLGDVARERHLDEVGVTSNALKYGLLFPGKTVLYQKDRQPRPAVVLCGTKYASYRILESDFSCSFPGYHRVASPIGSEILIRDDIP